MINLCVSKLFRVLNNSAEMMVSYVFKLMKAIGVIYFDFYCVVRCVKQGRGQKRVSTVLLAIQN